MNLKKSVFILFFCCAATPPIHAFFNNTQLVGARPLGMGGAYASVSDDANAVNINPAGMTQLRSSELSLTYDNLYGVSNLSENNLAFAIPWGYNSYGFSYQRLSLTDVYSEESINMAYSRALRRTISAGINLKYLRLSQSNFIASDATAQGSASELGADFGLWTTPWESFNLGLVIYNLNTPRMQLVSNSQGERLLPTARLGLSYRPKPYIIFAGDLHTTDRGTLDDLGNNYHLGTEYTFAKIVALRLGDDRNKFSGGIGINYKWTRIDFAFFNQGDLGLLYRVSLILQWVKTGE